MDGVVPHAHFCSTVRQRTAGGSRSSSNGGSRGGHISDDDDACAVPGGRRERFIFMRGVQWSAEDVDSVGVKEDQKWGCNTNMRTHACGSQHVLSFNALVDS